jgi:hypothetical protein
MLSIVHLRDTVVPLSSATILPLKVSARTWTTNVVPKSLRSKRAVFVLNGSNHMFSKFGIKLLAGAVATAIAGGAMANTSLDATTTGDIFLNIVNTANSTSYLFDTGVSQSGFNNNTNASCASNGTCNFVLSGDANLTGFLSTPGGTFDYSVVSATKNPTTDIDVTGTTTPTASITSFTDNQAQGAIANFIGAANAVAPPNTSTTSTVLPTGSFWGAGGTEGVVSNRIFANAVVPYSDQAAFGTALAFYNIVGSTAATFAGTWNFSGTTDTLSYSAVSAVPLPTPLLLLLSGIGLMGAVSRRVKAAV